MSRLDYITIAIVVLCVLAIGFLVYKMTDLFKGDVAADKTEIVADTVETEADDSYDYEIDPKVDSTGTAAGNGQTAQPGASAPAIKPAPSTSKPSEKAQDASNTAAEDDTEAGNSTTDAEPASSSGGKYMVIGGTFAQRAGAEKEVAKLKKLGYENAKVEIFNRGKFAVVLIDRFGTMAEAENLLKELKDDKVTAIVKTKQG